MALREVNQMIAASRKAVGEGRFGKLLHADMYMKWFRPAEYYRMDPWRGQRRSGSGVTIAQGVVQASTALWPGTGIRIEMNGDNGAAIMSGDRMETWKFRGERPEDAGVRRYGTAGASTGAADLGFREHQVVIEDLVDAIRGGHEPFIPVWSKNR